MIFQNNKKMGTIIMIVSILLAMFSFIFPQLFRAKINYGTVYDLYYYSFVKILSWCFALIMLFLFGFATFLKGERSKDDNNSKC